MKLPRPSEMTDACEKEKEVTHKKDSYKDKPLKPVCIFYLDPGHKNLLIAMKDGVLLPSWLSLTVSSLNLLIIQILTMKPSYRDYIDIYIGICGMQ